MTARTQALLVGPIGAMLLVHLVALVVAGRHLTSDQGGDLWGTWNLAAPVGLMIAGGYVLRRATSDDPAPQRRLLVIAWAAAAIDLVATATIAMVIRLLG